MPLIFSQNQDRRHTTARGSAAGQVSREPFAVDTIVLGGISLGKPRRQKSGLKLLLCMMNMHALVASALFAPRGGIRSCRSLSRSE